MENIDIIKTAILIALGVYEVVVRLVPSVYDWTIIGNLFKWLKVISDVLNSTKK